MLTEKTWKQYTPAERGYWALKAKIGKRENGEINHREYFPGIQGK